MVTIKPNFQTARKKLVFRDYPNLKIGISTNSFGSAIPLNEAGVTEIIEYASKEGYQFVEIRDVMADKLPTDCLKALAEVAKENKIDIIYVIGIDPLDPGFYEVFERGLKNTLIFPVPGIMRTLVSKPVFDPDINKKGWNKEELNKLTIICEDCTTIAKSKNIQFVVENLNEAFFGDGLTYYGLADLLTSASNTAFQLDIGNLFRNTTRVRNDLEKVINYLPTLGNRWVETHLKTIQEGEPQVILTENPLTCEKVVEMMGKLNIPFVMIELIDVPDKQQCFNNHAKSIQFLKDKGILKK